MRAISILALISLSLGIINLFPFLPLDGGHIFWALAEKLRGRAISFRVMERASLVGFVLVLLLFYVGLSNDIGRSDERRGLRRALMRRLDPGGSGRSVVLAAATPAGAADAAGELHRRGRDERSARRRRSPSRPTAGC